MWTGLQETVIRRIAAAQLRLPQVAVFSGMTAAWIHGIEVLPCEVIEVTVPPQTALYRRSGIRIRRGALPDDDVIELRGTRVTGIVRTLADICGVTNVVDGVVVTDAALHSRRVNLSQLCEWVNRHHRRRGIRNFRHVIALADPKTESPMESRLRMVLVLGGLPKPKVQVSIYDSTGRFAGRPDLYYEDAHLGIEYDGAVHRDGVAADDRRQNRLLNAGVRMLRFTANDVLGNPASVVAQVRQMLKS
jgi:very-short-patch-repair endonuclease